MLNYFISYIKIICLLFIGLQSKYIYSQTLTVNGSDWTISIPTISEAGNDYGGIYESSSDQILLNTSVPLVLGTAKVSVHYEPDPTWHNDLNLSIRRTSSGSAICVICSINGGNSYQSLTLTDIELYRIEALLALASYTGIAVQLKLSGVSVALPATNYRSKVVFTVGPL